MKLYFSEYPGNYSNYHFPYQVIMQLEDKDDLARAYGSGFLPFRSKKNLFYIARSARIRLGQFTLSSENRRILRKMEYLTLQIQGVENFTYTKSVQKLCVSSVKKISTSQHPVIQPTEKFMSTAAIRKLFTGEANCNYVMSFIDTRTNNPVGYVAIVTHENFIHYAHPFIDPNIDDKNLNIGMMTLAAQWAFSQHKQHLYLGTCYTPGSLYKTQFAGFEFFNGFQWTNNIDELKYLIHRVTDCHLLQDKSYQQQFGEIKSDSELEKTGLRVKFK